MKENIPLNVIPLPDYTLYRSDLCNRYKLSTPLKTIPFSNTGNLSQIPPPLNQQKKGWPWNIESEVQYFNLENQLKLSVIIPTYQQGTFIEESIRSVLLQNYSNLELIIVDGDSTDNTLSILEYYKNFISAFVSETDRGQTHAINKGFSLATGDLYYWLNSDDFLNKNSLNIVIPNFIRYPNLDILYGDGYTLNEQSQKLKFTYAPWVTERYLRFGSIVLSHSIIWRSKVHCALWEDLNCAMDAELWLRLFKNRRSKHCHFPIGTLRIHPDQKTSKKEKWEEKWKQDYERFIWKWYPAIGKKKWKLRYIEFKVVQKVYQLYQNINFKRELKS